MPETRSAETCRPLVAAAEQLLSRGPGPPVRLGEVELLSDEGRRNVLVRCRAVDDAARPGYIIKQVVAEKWDADDHGSWDTQRFHKDWAGARFLGELAASPAISPRYYGGDRTLGLFVIEDLGVHASLVEPLLEGTRTDADSALRAFAIALGRLHGSTAAATSRYEAICREHAAGTSRSAGPDVAEPSDGDKLLGLLERIGVAAGEALPAEMESVRSAMESPGPFLAFIHGDPCPDNTFLIGGEIKLIDFEFGRLGHALVDGVYGRMMFPTCWCCNRLPESTVQMMEAAYRAEIAGPIPAAQDDRLFADALVDACAFWVVRSCAWHLEAALDEDREWGIATIRPRLLARMEAFIAAAATHCRLPALRSATERLLDALRTRWPDAEPLPLYPAFR
jgi:hypothetical protein